VPERISVSKADYLSIRKCAEVLKVEKSVLEAKEQWQSD